MFGLWLFKCFTPSLSVIENFSVSGIFMFVVGQGMLPVPGLYVETTQDISCSTGWTKKKCLNEKHTKASCDESI